MFVVGKPSLAPGNAVRERAEVDHVTELVGLSAADSTAMMDQRRYYSGGVLPFFSSVSDVRGSTVQKKQAPWYPSVGAILSRSPNLRVAHAVLLPLVSSEGTLSLKAFTEGFLRVMVPPRTDLSYARTWFTRISVAGATDQPSSLTLSTTSVRKEGVVETSKAPDLTLPYISVLQSIDALFNGSDRRAAKWVFSLCDLTATGYILKQTMKHLRVRDTALSDFELPAAVGTVSKLRKPSVLGLSPTRVQQSMAADPPDDLTYLVAKAILQCFERIEAAEVAKAQASAGRKKKSKKGKQVALPVMRQFHMDLAEFTELLATDDGSVICVLIPFILKRSLEEEVTALVRPST